MKTTSFRLCLLLAYSVTLLASCAHDVLPAADHKPKIPGAVSFPGSAAGIFDSPVQLTGQIKRPAGAGPFAAVILLHGCGGITPKRDERWVEKLVGLGYVTLQVDSFGPRGIDSACTFSGNDAIDIVQRRVTDAYAAKRYLASLPEVDRKRIALMGWSHGGLTTVQALYQEKEEPFRAAVALYPACQRPLTGLNAPLLILIGADDDWTSASRCQAMLPREKAEPEVFLKVYPGAKHGFDILGADRYVQGSRGRHHLQYQKEAASDAALQVRDFLGKQLR